ncbi:MAG: S41 family peptidase, partial [Duncaniella sp.]|nr:S41 family peptidase [Duncaniella sp.]
MKKLLYSILLAAALVASVTLRAQLQLLDPARKVALAEHIIANYYVDPIDTTKVVEEAIKAMLKTLDPHSLYSNAEETRSLNEPLEGNFSGIGIRFQVMQDTVYVVEVIGGGPSERVGIQPGDRILSCNDTVMAGVSLKNPDILRLLRGPKGSLAVLKVARRGSSSTLEFRVIRDDIPIYSIDASYMVNDSVGFVSIARFGETTADELREAMAKLRSSGMRHLIIDLSDNGGGYLRSATDIASMFLRKGDLVVYTESPKGGRSEFVNDRDGIFLDGRLAVIVNRNSASASEILAGAIQDNDRGVIVGVRSFGKGLVQRPFPFPDGSMIRLTVSRYYTPAGRCIQRPYTDGDDPDYRNDILHRIESGELTSRDSIHFPDSLRRRTVRLGRTVYGGGGIMPDLFVPVDTSYYTPLLRDLIARGTLSGYAVQYVDDNRKALLARYPEESRFISDFTVTPELLDGLLARADRDSIPRDSAQLTRSLPVIEANIKGLIGRDLYD